jgi:hypothetical protein
MDGARRRIDIAFDRKLSIQDNVRIQFHEIEVVIVEEKQK